MWLLKLDLIVQKVHPPNVKDLVFIDVIHAIVTIMRFIQENGTSGLTLVLQTDHYSNETRSCETIKPQQSNGTSNDGACSMVHMRSTMPKKIHT